MACNILTECGYSNLENVRLDITSFGLEITGILKVENHVKGYRAFM
jgi:hypothetical protein